MELKQEKLAPSFKSRLLDLNRSVTNIQSACRISSIALNDAMILSYEANLGRMEFSEGTRFNDRARNHDYAGRGILAF